MQKAQDLFGFAREFLRNPRNTGAICPSSPFLARRMAAMVPAGDGKVVELGPGNGPMTLALLQRGIAPEDLILVERSRRFAEQLRHRFPKVNVIHGDARDLTALLGTLEKPLRAVVSSLPLRSLPTATVEAIGHQITEITRPGNRFIQFTYHLHDRDSRMNHAFELVHRSIVWRNFPPARVDVLSRCDAAALKG